MHDVWKESSTVRWEWLPSWSQPKDNMEKINKILKTNKVSLLCCLWWWIVIDFVLNIGFSPDMETFYVTVRCHIDSANEVYLRFWFDFIVSCDSFDCFCFCFSLKFQNRQQEGSATTWPRKVFIRRKRSDGDVSLSRSNKMIELVIRKLLARICNLFFLENTLLKQIFYCLLFYNRQIRSNASFYRGTANISLNSPIWIKKHFRCTGNRKMLNSIKRLKGYATKMVNEFRSSRLYYDIRYFPCAAH